MARTILSCLLVAATVSGYAQSNTGYIDVIDGDSVLMYIKSSNVLDPGMAQFTAKDCAKGFRLTRLTPEGHFDGRFADYFIVDRGGNPVLLSEGNYRNGKKAGVWTWYYADRTVMVQGNFADDKPSGTWKFYEGHGELEKVLEFRDGPEPLILYLYDVQGKFAMVKDGNGEARFACTGEIPYAVSRRVRNGLPEGEWIGEIEIWRPEGEKVKWMRKETYREGKMVQGKKFQSGRVTDVCCTPELTRMFPTPAIAELVSLETFPEEECVDWTKMHVETKGAKPRSAQPVSSLMMFQSSVKSIILSKYQGRQVGEAYNPVGLSEENQLVMRFDTDEKGRPIHVKLVSAFGREFYLPIKRALESQTTFQPDQTRLILNVFIRMSAANYGYRISFSME